VQVKQSRIANYKQVTPPAKCMVSATSSQGFSRYYYCCCYY